MTKEAAEKIVRGITDKIECNTADIDDWAEYWGFTREEYEDFLDMAVKAAGPKPYEKFESTKDHIYKLAGDYKCWDNRLTDDEAVELCHILEQETKSEWEHDHEILKAYADGANNALDKIRAEIEQIHLIGYATVNGKREIASRAVMQILDKYNSESEE